MDGAYERRPKSGLAYCMGFTLGCSWRKDRGREREGGREGKKERGEGNGIRKFKRKGEE